jgi:nicotinamidase-related amidase
MDIDHAALIVIDVQNGFINHHSGHVVPAVAALVERWAAASRPVVFTRYLNYADSPFERLFDWKRLQHRPETDIVPELVELAAAAYAVIDKPAYSLYTEQGVAVIAEAGWTDLVFCGIATESCVLKSAADAFERGHTPWIVTDASASDAGPAVHDAGLVVARRLIGRRQLLTTEEVFRELDPRLRASVLE